MTNSRRIFLSVMLSLVGLTFALQSAQAQRLATTMAFTVSMPDPKSHYYQVEFTVTGLIRDSILFKMPQWMPGYYQIMNYAANVENMKATDPAGKALAVKKRGVNGWSVASKNSPVITLRYAVKTTTVFVAASYLDEERGYICPAGVFVYADGYLQHPSTVTVKPFDNWTRVATGLDSIPGKKFQYTAGDFDQLFDSPILVGNLEELPAFTIQGIRHRFIGYKLGTFDRALFMSELKKAVTAGIAVIGDIPYKHYTFIAIGPARGGIEHLNSTSFGFDGSELNNPAGRQRMLSFLSHEYFHHYNIKRIRPVELGPFDYDKANRSNSLWVSEGLSVYYEMLMVKRAGLISRDELLTSFQHITAGYENKSGHLFQSLVQSSYDTWSDGPFGRTGDEVNKTISYYDKGAIVGILLDFAIRNSTGNKRSLDDVMRFVYTEYYQKKKRGFSDAEFQEACEVVAGQSLTEFFEYVYTTKEVDYNKYLAFGGLSMDTKPAPVTGGWLGAQTRQREDKLVITGIDYQSPAQNSGLHGAFTILKVNGDAKNKKQLDELLLAAKPGDVLKLDIESDSKRSVVEVTLGQKTQASYVFANLQNPTPLQTEIQKSWLGE